MVMMQRPEFVDKAPGGRYWRYAPEVKFSETPCEAGKPYEGPATHTRRVGYDDATLARLADAEVIALHAQAVVLIKYLR